MLFAEQSNYCDLESSAAATVAVDANKMLDEAYEKQSVV